jgi:adenine-specific DNA-methyltransferase
MARLLAAYRLRPTAADSVQYVRFLDDFPVVKRNNFWPDGLTGSFTEDKVYVVQSPTKIVARCLLLTTDPGDLVLDPTCGSGTTAYVAEHWGRRWITCDTSRVSLTLARTRLMAGRFPYYLLADSPEGRRKETEINPQITQMNADKNLGEKEKKGNLRTSADDAVAFSSPSPNLRTSATSADNPLPLSFGSYDIRRGFIYERVPHVTLKSIANNEEIDAIHTKWQKKLEPLLTELNKPLKTKWREWEVPRAVDRGQGAVSSEGRNAKAGRSDHGSLDTGHLLEEWWRIRGLRQKEIDETIARHADTEILYDRPYEDKKTVRVTGPFTVESLSPHRTISVEEKRERAEVGIPGEGVKVKAVGPDDFGRMILENLRTAGVQNTFKGERLKFDTLEPFAGQWIHGRGEYTEAGGKVCRAAVCIGPEHGTVGPELVKEAAKEAVQGVGFDVLIVCGFAFDPHVSEEAKRYGKLVVLACRMNPDLAMGDLLKKTGAGNLFMVFGEPDIEIKKTKDGQVTAEIHGLDVYDPTTGEIRSSSTDDIACWFIDTNYSGEAFFVRHAYFTGANEPYEKLKRALRAEIDEAAWSALYSTKSRPFPKPDTGKIAVKVINHYGDEVLKVYEVGT